MSQKIIGLAGKKRSGKDTAGELLINNYGYIKYSFAGPLKKACKEIFLLSEDQVEGSKKESQDNRWGVTPRKIFQIIGTEMFRENLTRYLPEIDCGNNFWIYRFKIWYNDLIKKNPNAKVVVTDVRFENESDIIQKLGGIVIKIKRNNKKKNNDNHKSETSIDKINSDFIIENNSTIKEYYDKIKKTLNL